MFFFKSSFRARLPENLAACMQLCGVRYNNMMFIVEVPLDIFTILTNVIAYYFCSKYFSLPKHLILFWNRGSSLEQCMSCNNSQTAWLMQVHACYLKVQDLNRI
jgi:hypothetical protein